MRSKSEIRDRVRALLVQDLDQRVEQATKRLPRQCVHNHRHPLDSRKTVDGEPNEMYNRVSADDEGTPVDRTLGLCMLNAESPEDWGGNICEDDIDAQRCPYFTPINTKETVLSDFEGQLYEVGGLEEHLPAAAELLWVIGETEAPTLPWWRRLLYWLLRIRVEPRRAVKDPIGLLNPPGDDDDEGVSS